MLKPIQLLLLIAALAGCDRPGDAPGPRDGAAQLPAGTDEDAGRQAGTGNTGNGGEPDNRDRVALTTTPPPVCVSLRATATEGRVDEEHRRECLRRLAELLAMPRLRPVVKPRTDTIVGSTETDSIVQAYFAQKAGIALLRTAREQRIIDLSTGDALFREPVSEYSAGSISPNGRVFVTGTNDISRIRDATTGETLVELDANPWYLQIPDARTLIYTLPKSSRSTLLDLDTGTEIPLTVFEEQAPRVVAAQDRSNAYTLFGSRMAGLVAVDRTVTPPYVRLVEAKQSVAGFSNVFLDTLSTDGRYVLGKSNGVTVIDLRQLRSEATEVKGLYIESLLPTSIPGQVLVIGKNHEANERMYFLLSLASRRLTPIDLADFSQKRIVYVAPLKRLAALDRNTLHLFDLEFIGDVESGTEDAGTLSRELQETYAATRKNPLAGKLKPLASDAEVWAVAIHKGATTRPGDTRPTVRVTLIGSHEDPPVVLLLSSYEPANWIVANEGPELRAVLLASYYPQGLEGTADVPVFDIGHFDFSRYKIGGASHPAPEIQALLGKQIDLFQRADEGDRFLIGPTRSR